jgi:hypothetical protein
VLTLGADRVDIFFGMVGILNSGKIVRIPEKSDFRTKFRQMLAKI